MLKLENISLTFNKGTVNEKKALEGLNLELERGDFVTVLGSNGAGKSTLFNTIAGTYLPDSGKVLLDGREITRQPDYKRSKDIGRLFQDPLKGTAPNMTIEENLALAYLRANHAKSPFSMVSRADRADFRERLKMLGLGLEDRMDQPVGLLSGGQRQALTLLMATLRQPKLLLLDEHTAALDPKTAAKVLEVTEKIVSSSGLTTMMITHNMRDAINYGNRLIMMYDGKIVVDVSGEEKKNLTVEQLLALFSKASGSDEADDKLLLS